MGRVFRPRFNSNHNFHNDKSHDNGKQNINWHAIREVRLIDENGQMVGIVNTQEALSMAREAGLDLVNISPNATPPVCKICDYGKYKYEQQKKQKNNKSVAKIKEIQLSINIDKNDLNIKLKKAVEFLQDKNSVRLVMQLKGRDMPRLETAMELMQNICERLKDFAKQIDEPKLTGRKIIALCR